LLFEYNNENGDSDDDDDDDDNNNNDGHGDYIYDGDSVEFIVLAVSLLSIHYSACFLTEACLLLGFKGCLWALKLDFLTKYPLSTNKYS
jgi:hypothetical protein